MEPKPEHTCKPPDSPGTYLSPERAKQIGREWKPPAQHKDFTCKCGREWIVCGEGWEPKEN